MRGHKKSQRTIEVETYVTLRCDWTSEMAAMVRDHHQARGHRVIDGQMEWQYFDSAAEAAAWCDAAHSSPNAIGEARADSATSPQGQTF